MREQDIVDGPRGGLFAAAPMARQRVRSPPLNRYQRRGARVEPYFAA